MNWLRALLKRDAVEKQLDKELRSHIEQLTVSYVSSGMSTEEARRKARLEFGGLEQVKEEYRDVRSLAFIDATLQDIRHGLRLMRKSPGFTAVAVLSLALGIGANTAIFSVIHTLMFRLLPIKAPEQVWAMATKESAMWERWPYEFFERLRDRSAVFSGVAATHIVERFNVAYRGQVDEGKARVGLVSGNYFAMLGIGTAAGRAISPDDDRVPGGAPVVVLSYGYWERRFAGAPDVINQAISFNGTSYTVIGIAARDYTGDWVGQPTDFWIPITMQAQALPESPSSFPRIIVRLKPDVSVEQAQAAANVLHEQFEQEMFGTNLGRRDRPFPGIAFTNAAAGYSPERRVFARPLAILTIVVGLVLLIACANIANLLLAKSAARQREIAVRLAMGAGPARILRQWMTESILLSLLGGAFGLMVATWGTQVLLKLIADGTQPVFLEVHPDARILGFTLAICILTGILSGLAPALRASKVAMSPTLNGDPGRLSRLGRIRFSLGKSLVISQVALSLILLMGAGLFIRTLHNLRSQDLGFDRGRLLVVWTAPGQTGRKGPALASLQRTIRERISALPGVISASQSSTGLLNSNYYWINGTERLAAQGQLPKPGGKWTLSMAAPKFFETAGIPLLVGRDFTEQDTTRAFKDNVAIINSSLARFLFADGNPVGQRLDLGNGAHTTVEIVGVASDAKSVSPRDRNLGMIYLSALQSQIGNDLCLVVRTAGSPEGLVSSLRKEFQNIDATLPVLRIMTIEQQLDETLASERLIAKFTAFFSALALLLACLGLYGVISYTAARRTAEMGVRLALGASRADVLGMIVGESMRLVITGLVIGVAVILSSSRLIASGLYGVSPADPLTIAAAIGLMAGVALLAALLPARRASRVDPMVALRYE